MFKIDNVQRVATAALGALLFTTVFVGAAVGPAHTSGTATVYAAAAQNSGEANA